MENESLYFVIIGEYLYYGTEDVIKKLDDTSVKEHPNKIWYYGLHDRLPLIMYKVYPIEKLTELDLGQNVNNTRHIRQLLYKVGLFNNIDKEYLDSIEFKDEDYDITINTMDLPTRMINSFTTTYKLIYMWELLLIDEYEIFCLNNIGTKSIEELNILLSQKGYSLRNSSFDINKADIMDINSNIERIKATRKIYMDKITQLDKELDCEVKKLLLIKRDNK